MDTMGAFESYVSAVDTGSLSGAARQRKMSQPAVSQSANSGTRNLVRSEIASS